MSTIQPCATCGRPTESDEYWQHNVACDSEACQDAKREDENRKGFREERLPDGGTRITFLGRLEVPQHVGEARTVVGPAR